MDLTVFFDVDFNARFFDDLVDDFALFTDDVADLINGDSEGNDLGRIGRKLGRNFGHAFEHFAQNEFSAFVSLIYRRVHNLFGNALDFYIHLDSGDTVFSSRDLKVHIAEEVF